MARWTMAAIVVGALVCVPVTGALVAAPARPDLAGRWTLVRQLSDFPSEVGFGMDLGSGGAGGAGVLSPSVWFRESEDDARRRDQLVEEVRNPPAHLVIKQSGSVVTISDDRGRSRTFHPNGRQESHELDKVGVGTVARWTANALEIRYKVEQYRELRYTFSRRVDPSLLVVQVRFVESGGNQVVTRVYAPTRADEPADPAAGPPAVPPLPGAAPGGTPPPASPPPAPNPTPSAPASGLLKPPAGAPLVPPRRGPGAELQGLSQIGVVIEELSQQAGACGLSHDSIEAAVSRSLTDAGFKVLRNSDEDTYVYVNINTSNVSPTLCVSRYDAFLYTYTTAVLPYQTTQVLAHVELMHRGGITGAAPGAHGETVMRTIKQYADEFAKRIRDANQR